MAPHLGCKDLGPNLSSFFTKTVNSQSFPVVRIPFCSSTSSNRLFSLYSLFFFFFYPFGFIFSFPRAYSPPPRPEKQVRSWGGSRGGHERLRGPLWRWCGCPAFNPQRSDSKSWWMFAPHEKQINSARYLGGFTYWEWTQQAKLGSRAGPGQVGNLSRLITWPPFKQYSLNIWPTFIQGRGWVLCSGRGQGRMLVQHPPTHSLAPSPEHILPSS